MNKAVLSTLLEISKDLANDRGLRANLTSLLDSLCADIGVSRGFVLLHQPETDKLEPVATSGLNIGEFRKLEFRVEKSPIRKVFETGEPLTVPRLAGEPALGFLADGEAENSLICVPISLGDKVLGVLAVEMPYQKSANLADMTSLYSLTASMISQLLRVENIAASERQKLIEENSHLRQELKEKHDFSHIVGNSSPMRQVYDQVTQVARSNATVLLRGESGTGKEMIANAIHYNSLRSKKPFIKVNCAALPESLIESELFGYEKGAFTGAHKLKKGRFEMADGGTLFLDEIGDLPPQTQIKLLRVIQEREFQRLGGTETIKTNIRLITATNKNLEEAIANGSFREDLFYRLNVFTIFLPPLRERKSDILLLAEHFVEKYEAEHGKTIKRISTPAIDMLTCYHYPGNVRELENAVERAVLVCDSNVIHGHHLPPTLQTAEVTGTITRVTLTSAVEAFERDLIQDALKTTGGNAAKAARLLDSTERILGYKIKKYEIDTIRFRR
jgi:Nif-specific regulatory protein